MNVVKVTTFVLLMCVIVYVVGKVYEKRINERIRIKASDGRDYLVRNTNNPEADKQTAEMLASLNSDLQKLIQRLSEDDEPVYREMVARIRARYNPEKLSEGIVDERYTSYTINKGEKIIMCMRSRDDDDRLYDKNKLFYVIVHELAHIGTVTKDHNEEFRRNFAYLLQEAQKHGLYSPINERFDYCGLNVHGSSATTTTTTAHPLG